MSVYSVLTCLAVLAFLGTPAFAQGYDPRSTVTVSGEGRVSAAPDLAEVSVGVVTEAPTAGEALKANSAAMTTLQDTIKQRGVAAKDLQTSNVNVQPRYSQPGPNQVQRGGEFVPRIVGYSVTNTVQVRVRELGKLGELLDAIVGAGANQVYGISFRIDESQALLDQARKRAMADAKRRAELLTGEAGLVLGWPIMISESGGSFQPPMAKPMMRGMAMMAADSVPISAGEQELAVAVQVVYLVNPPE